jgi:hypothetical protein
MAKPDMPYALFPWLVPPAYSGAGWLTADLATAFKWYWRVRTWTATMTASFSVSFSMSDGSTVGVSFAMSALETFDVLGAGLDELALAIPLQDGAGPAPYRWILRGSASVSGALVVTDSTGYASGTFSGHFFPDDGGSPSTARTLFAPGRDASYSDGYHHMTRDPSSGLFTPFLGAYGPPLWQGGAWADYVAESGGGFGGNCRINPTRLWSDGIAGLTHTGSESIAVNASLDGHSFACAGFVQWYGTGSAGEGAARSVESVTYGSDGAISLVIVPTTPGGYWTYAPRIDPGNPTYDADTGAIATNPATGAPWTIQEIISRHGP